MSSASTASRAAFYLTGFLFVLGSTFGAPFALIALQAAIYGRRHEILPFHDNIFIWMLVAFFGSLLILATLEGVRNGRSKKRALTIVGAVIAVMLVTAVGPMQRFVGWNSEGLRVGGWYVPSPRQFSWDEVERIDVVLQERSYRRTSVLTKTPSNTTKEKIDGRFLVKLDSGQEIDLWEGWGIGGYGATPVEALVSLARAASEAGVHVAVGVSGVDLVRQRLHRHHSVAYAEWHELVLEAVSKAVKGQDRVLVQSETGSAGNWSFSLKESRYIQKIGMFRSGPKARLLEVTLALANNRPDPANYTSSVNVRLRSDSEDFEKVPLIAVSENFGVVPPSTWRTAKLYFQVPPEEKNLRLVVQGGLVSKERLTLAVSADPP